MYQKDRVAFQVSRKTFCRYGAILDRRTIAMKFVRILLVPGLLLPLAVIEAEEPVAAKQSIRKVLDDQVVAWNKGDLKGFMQGYWESDQLTFFSGNTRTGGWKATLERYQKKYQGEGKEMGRLAFEELTIDMLGEDHALVRGRFRLQLKDDKPTGLFTLILWRTRDGWRIIHDHTSS
jgi:beta-aspartyl-peptidase (threonine type)